MAPSTDPNGCTGQLCDWVSSLKIDDIPQVIQERTKYLILDGLACALMGAHLPASEVAVKGVLEMESGGVCNVLGWGKKTGPLAAALLNSTFIQGFELDDYHSEAPIHGSSIILPTLLALVDLGSASEDQARRCVDGKSFLLAAIVGYEVGPRIGLGVYGGQVLSMGWHSGAVFGPAAAACAASKLLDLQPDFIEDAIGMACTQAGGLMSAQYESMVKRMQHGFAARNGLFSALMARSGYTGIKRVLETPYGGFLSNFSHGNGQEPQYNHQNVVNDLGKSWEINRIIVKPWASMAATHGTISCVAELQNNYQAAFEDLENIKGITVEMSGPAYKKGGWAAKRPLTATGAQMNCSYAAAVQLIDRQVLPAQFTTSKIERDDVWELIQKITCNHNKSFDENATTAWYQKVTVEFKDGRDKLKQFVRAPKGIDPPLSNDEILTKWRKTTENVVSRERRDAIEALVLTLESEIDVRRVADLLFEETVNIID